MKNCEKCGAEFEIVAEDKEFYEKISPVIAGKKYLIPAPKLCVQCRMQRRMVFRNYINLYKRKCDFSGEEMISLYSADKPYTVYKENYWWSDKWDVMDYGRDYDFSKSFFEQFGELLHEVPRRGMHQDGTHEGSDYIAFGTSNKNCYLLFAGFYCEDVYYSSLCGMSRDIMDCFVTLDSELCYECIACNRCYNLCFSMDCDNCRDSYFLDDCRNCENCICCKNLRNKRFYIYNEPVSEKEFNDFKGKMLSGSIEKEAKKFEKWKLTIPFVYTHIENSENVSGDYITDSKNCHECFNVFLGGEDYRYVQYGGWGAKDMMDTLMCGKNGEKLYEMQATIDAYNCAFTNFCRDCNDVFYCDSVMNCKNCFGCNGLVHKEYCIFNKQYPKEEYERIVAKIIEQMTSMGEWGEFFPVGLSPFAYNETIANEHFLLHSEDALSKGFQWKEEENDMGIIGGLKCEECGKGYKIIEKEKRLHEKWSVPEPKKCWKCRHFARISHRNPFQLWTRECDKCEKVIETSYSPERPEIVYCEKCYLDSIY